MKSHIYKLLIFVCVITVSFSAIAEETQLSEYELSPLANYLSEKQFNELRKGAYESDLESKPILLKEKL